MTSDTPQKPDIKSQRDRFLAFSFAGADILLEIDTQGHVVFVMGAVKSLLGIEEKDVLKNHFSDLFSEKDKELMVAIQNSRKVASKQGPYLVTMESPKDKTKRKHAFINAFRMYPDGNISIAITQGDGLLRVMGFDQDKDQDILSSNKDFETLVHKKIADRIARNKNTNVQMIQLNNLEEFKSQMEDESWADFMSSLGQVIMSSSLDGESAIRLDQDKYVLLNENDGQDTVLQEKISSLAKKFDVDIPLNLQTQHLAADPDALNARETTRAIMYTLKKMEKGGVNQCGKNLKDSFSDFLKENAKKISDLKRIISHQEFTVHFQPIVSLATREISHHEVLMRFEKQNSPYELIVMGEEVGIAPDIDLSVCRQAIKYIDINKNKKIGNFAVNLSGASVQNDMFLDKLLAVLKEYPNASKQLIFEITESSEIKDLERVNGFIQNLRNSGYPVCLDDFGAGAASFQYLQKLTVDGIKIDGSYVKTIMENPRDATMVKNITKMCHELDVYVVAEMIETKEQAQFLLDMGVDKGQGWLYGKAMPEALLTLPPISSK